MEAGAQGSPRRGFDHLREHSIGLPQVLFQSITHMAPAAAVAYSIYISVPDARQALPLSVGLALIACLCAATAIGQLAKHLPSAGGLYTYSARSLGPWAGLLTAWLFVGFQPLVAPFLYLEFGWAMHDVFNTSIGWHWSGQWVVWVLLMAAIVFLLTYRDVRLSTTAGVILGAFEIGIFAALALWILFSKTGDLNMQPFNPNHAVGTGAASSRGWCSRSSPSSASRPRRRSARRPRTQAHGAARGRRLCTRDRRLLRALLLRVGVRRRVQQLRRPGHRRRSVAEPRQGLLGHGLGDRVPRDLQLDRGELERGHERGDARVLLARAQRARAAHARADPREVQDADVAIIWLTGISLVSRCLSAGSGTPASAGVIATLAVPLVVPRLHARLRRLRALLPDDAAEEFNPFLHLVPPIGGIVLFFFPLYYQFYKVPPPYPFKYANWVAIGYTVIGDHRPRSPS